MVDIFEWLGAAVFVMCIYVAITVFVGKMLTDDDKDSERLLVVMYGTGLALFMLMFTIWYGSRM